VKAWCRQCNKAVPVTRTQYQQIALDAAGEDITIYWDFTQCSEGHTVEDRSH